VANGTDFKLDLTLDTKKARKALERYQKESKKQLDKQIKLEGKYNKTRRRELEYEKRVKERQFRDQKKHYKDIDKARRKGWRDEKVHQRKVWREQKTIQREAYRHQKQLQREQRRREAPGRVARGLASAGAGIAGFAIGGAIASYGRHLEVEKARSGLIGLHGSGVRDRFLRGGKGWGTGAGFNMAETAQHAKMAGRATGYQSPREMQQFMRATAMEAGETSQLFSAITQGDTKAFAGGQEHGESRGAHKLTKIMSIAMGTGLKKARFPEFAKGVTSILKAQSARGAGSVDAMNAAKVLGLLQSTGLAGFKGERGAQVAMKLDQAFMKPGGGEWGQGLFQRAMGFGVQGSGRGYFEAEMQREKGIQGEGNLEALLDQVLQESGRDTKEGALAMRAATGLSLEQSKTLLDKRAAGKLTQKDVKRAQEKSVSLEQQSVNNMEKMGATLERLATRFNAFADIGKVHAKDIEAVQDAQLAALKFLSSHLAPMSSYLQTWLGTEKNIGPEEVAKHMGSAEKIKERMSGMEEGYEKSKLRHQYGMALAQAANADQSEYDSPWAAAFGAIGDFSDEMTMFAPITKEKKEKAAKDRERKRRKRKYEAEALMDEGARGMRNAELLKTIWKGELSDIPLDEKGKPKSLGDPAVFAEAKARAREGEYGPKQGPVPLDSAEEILFYHKLNEKLERSNQLLEEGNKQRVKNQPVQKGSAKAGRKPPG
jgi:hypothetical protein